MNPHFKYDIMHRNRKDNIIASGAYQFRKEMIDETELDPEKRNKSSNTNRKDILCEKILIPENNPSELKNASVEYLLNKLNTKRGNRLAVRGQLAHQPELTLKQNIEAVELFAKRLALDYNCIFLYATHNEINGNNNIHTHFMASLYPLIGGEFVSKTERNYIDENGKPLKKIDQPVLKRGKLQYNPDGTWKTKKGWKDLDLDQNNNIQFDEKGHVKLKDIRVPLKDKNGNRIYYQNGKYKKPDWLHIKVKKTEMEKIRTAERTRYLWQDCLNEICKRHKIKDKNTGKIIQFDFRSNAEKDKDLPIHQRRIKRWKIGPYKNKKAILHNEWCDRIEKNEIIPDIANCPFKKLQMIYAERQESLQLTKQLEQIRYDKTLPGKATKKIRELKAFTSSFIRNIKNLIYNEITEKQEPKNQKTLLDQFTELQIRSNREFYKKYPHKLTEVAEKKATEAERIIKFSQETKTYTKENYYIVSDVSKAYKELLQFKISLKAKMPLEQVENLRSKEFKTMALKTGLKKEYNNYDTWLQKTKMYYSNVPDTERKKKRSSSIPEKIYNGEVKSFNVPDANSDNKGIDSKFNMNWNENKKPENEMEKADKELYDKWVKSMDNNITILPPDLKNKGNYSKINSSR